ncbi:MAG: MFS transporter [Propionibacteriales bacterium]|nr:MFS transporter [Propionibacteriales bacterium]
MSRLARWFQPVTDERRQLNPFSRDSPLAASYLCVFLYSSGEAALHVLVPPYLSDGLGYGPGIIGLLLAVFALSSLVLRLPVGASYSADRVRPILLVGGLLSTGAFVVVPLTQSAVLLGVLLAMDGVGWAMATTTQLTVLVASRPSRLSIASAMGWYSGFTGLGHALGAATAGIAADAVGYTAGFLLLASMPALATVVMLRALPAQLAAAHAKRLETVNPGPDGAEEPDPAPVRDPERSGVLATLRAAGALPLAVFSGAMIMFFINVQSALFGSFHPVLALSAGLTLTQIGVLASCRSLASSVTRMGLGVLFARTSGSWLTTPMLLLGAATLFLLPIVRAEFWLQVVLFLAAGLSRGILRVTGASMAFEGVGGEGERQQGLVAAWLHIGLDLGKVAGPPLGGLVAELVGVPAMFQVSAVVLVVAYLAFWAAARIARTRRRPG